MRPDFPASTVQSQLKKTTALQCFSALDCMCKVVTSRRRSIYLSFIKCSGEHSYKAIANKLRNVGWQIQTCFNVIYRH